jgi:hypothetical protein
LLRLSPILPDKPKTPRPGTGKHQILYIADDFDATPEGFEEYI